MQIVTTSTVRPAAFRDGFGAIDPTTDIVALAPGGAIARREHSPAGLLLVLHGTVVLDRDGAFQPAAAGTVVALPAGVRQTLRNAGETEARVIVYTPASGFARAGGHSPTAAGAAAD